MISSLNKSIGNWDGKTYINSPTVDLNSTVSFFGFSLVLDGTKYADTISLYVRETGKIKLQKYNKTTKEIIDLEEITILDKGVQTYKLKQIYHISEEEVFVLSRIEGYCYGIYETNNYILPYIGNGNNIYEDKKGVPLVHLTYYESIGGTVLAIQEHITSISEKTEQNEDDIKNVKAEIKNICEAKAEKADIYDNFINTPNTTLDSSASYTGWQLVLDGTKYADTVSLTVREAGKFLLRKLNKTKKELFDLEEITTTVKGIQTFKLSQVYHLNEDEVFVIKNTQLAPVQYYATDEYVMPTVDDNGNMYTDRTGIPLVHLTAKVLKTDILSAYLEEQDKELGEIDTFKKITLEATQEAINRAVNSIWYGKTVGYVGDSYADASSNIFSPSGELYHPTYPEVFAKKNNKCNVIDKSRSGSLITNGYIYQSALQIVKDYGDKLSELRYPIATKENTGHSEIGGKIHLPNCSKLDYILVNVFPNSSSQKTNDWLNMRLWVYDKSTEEYSEFGKYSYMHEMPNSESWDWSYCIAMYCFDEPIEIEEGKEFAISFTLGQRKEDTVNSAITIVNDDTSYTCNGTSRTGYPLVQYGLRSQLDYQIFEGGLNDTGKEIGSLSESYDLNQEFNIDTYYGSLEAMIVEFRKKSQTTKLGWVILPGDWQTPNENKPILDVCRKWAVDVLNLEEKWRGMIQGLNKQYTRTSENSNWIQYNPYYFIKYDGSHNGHPSPVFYKLFNDTIFEWMRTL